MLFCGALDRSNNSYIIYRFDCQTLCFQESERDLHYVGLIGKKILKKVEAMETSIPELKVEFPCIMCGGEKKKKNSFEIHEIILRYTKM